MLKTLVVIMLFVVFWIIEFWGGLLGNDIDLYLGVHMRGGATAIFFHNLYYQVWGILTAMLIYFLVNIK